ncbi:hypothetical protein [Botrimarina hoheduenensis]|uniref:PEP-CTERM protein-sorting domain-containing protein n=1 Tax=Botrimarina hoheduenensis TaxID=2528000 RepID=A0A5C5WBL1_9BACT|nr:hypothetical protein [Botrimarina hoheduenensis]TWT47623.1 hypothetical protein Pla111_12390 [Botrimarina hoheduenensis]
MKSFIATLSGVAAVCLLSASLAQAATIELQFTGLDVLYDGTNITDANNAGADPLGVVTVDVDGSPVAGSPFSTAVSAELLIPGVFNIAVGGDTVMSAPGGSVTVNLPAGNFLTVALDSATITYLNAGFARFAFGGAVANVTGQSLPGGLMMGDPISFSFSAILASQTNNGVDLLTFRASGTGEIEGAVVPEPATALLAALAAPLALGRRR